MTFEIPDLGREAERELGATMATAGLLLDGRSETSITYRDLNRMITLGYYQEDIPSPALMVSVGLRSVEGKLMQVGLWRLFPAAEQIRDLSAISFSSPAALAQLLSVVRDVWLPRFIWPALSNPRRLRNAWLAQQAERDEHYQAEVLHAQLERARAAFEAGDHAAAVAGYASIGRERLSAADRRRDLMARRALGEATWPEDDR